MKLFELKSKCYEIGYDESHWGMGRTCYIFADSPEEAAAIFKAKKYFQWEFKSMRELGKAFDKNSEKID